MEYYTIDEAAARLGMKYHFVYDRLRSGEIKGARFGRAWRISSDELRKYEERAARETMRACCALRA